MDFVVFTFLQCAVTLNSLSVIQICSRVYECILYIIRPASPTLCVKASAASQRRSSFVYNSLCSDSVSLILAMKSAFSTHPTHSTPRSARIFFSCLTRSLE